jgi:ribonuclease VapC
VIAIDTSAIVAILMGEADAVSFDRESRAAFVRFGKGRHPARLNFGDCVSYALAQVRGLPLLYKGEDFAKTDVVSAVP